MSKPFRRVTTGVPTTIILVSLIALTVIIGPLIALAIRVPWDRFTEVLSQDATKDLLIISLSSAAWATVCTLLLGVPLAAWLSSLQRGGEFVRLFVLLPLAMPPVVAGLALSAAIGNRGLTAPLLDTLGLRFAFAFPGVVVSHIFIALPFVVVSVDSALRQIDEEVKASASGVGMSNRAILWKITIPAIASAIATGAGLAFARSLGEFGTTLTFAGSLPGVTRTMPLGIYLEREIDPDRAYVLAAMLIILAFIVLALASLPILLRRRPREAARSVGDFDAERLRELSAPQSGALDVRVRFGESSEDTYFPAGTTTAIVGPNGAGKTTLSSMIAGRLRGMNVQIGDRVVDGEGTYIPARDRGVVLLTQKPGLPRTTTALGAVTMATRDKDLSAKLLEAAGLKDLADVPVTDLSGGQAAQVALVRALGARPSVLILDEPLAAIDVASASRWRRLLRAASGERTIILVTHDIIDVAGLSNHLVVVEAGRTVTQGPTDELLQRPPTSFLAQLAGVNRLAGKVSGIDDGLVTLNVGSHHLDGFMAEDLPAGALSKGGPALAVFDHHDVTLRVPTSTSTSDSHRVSARNILPAQILDIDGSGQVGHSLITLELEGGELIRVPLTHRSAVDMRLEPAMTVECLIKATNIAIYPQHQAALK